MSYCTNCGKKTEDGQYLCDECRKVLEEQSKQEAVSQDAQSLKEAAPFSQQTPAEPFARGKESDGGFVQSAQNGDSAQPKGSPAGADEPFADYASPPNTAQQSAAPSGIPYFMPNPAMQAAVPESNRKINVSGLLGLIFSLIGGICLVMIIVLLISFMMANPELVDNPNAINPSDLMALGGGMLLCMIGALLFSVAGIACSGVGIVHRAKYRLNELAVGGLVIGIIVAAIVILIIASVAINS